MRIAKRSKGPVEKARLTFDAAAGRDAVLVLRRRSAPDAPRLGGYFTIFAARLPKIALKFNSSPLKTGDHAAVAKIKPSLFFARLVNPTINQSSLEG